MSRAILLAVDDDVDVLDALAEDLRRQYGADYRILCAQSGAAALDTLTQLKERQETVALILSDQQMSGMPGVEFLARAREICPDAKRVLLAASADAEAAVNAINSARIHYYLLKPWDPPAQKLYPALNGLLEEWRANCCPPPEGLRVLGRRWSLRDHLVRNFLSRNHVPYRWIDVSSSEEAGEILEGKKLAEDQLPAVLFPDGTLLANPAADTLAERVGLSVQAAQEFYDLIIVGAGPAGMAAAVYAASEGLKTLVLEPEAPGGQAGSTSLIENYLGFPSGITGAELGRRALAQATRLGAEFITQRAVGLCVNGRRRCIRLASGAEISSHVVLLAAGVQFRKLEAAGADRFTGRGIYYGAALVEAANCQGEVVYIVGGANSAGQAALHFSRFACSVVMLVRGEGLSATMSKYLIDEIETNPKIRVETCTEVVRVEGDERLTALILRGPEGERRVEASSLFVFIGAAPGTDWLPPEIERDPMGFVLAGPDLLRDGKPPAGWTEKRDPYLLETSVPGVFVAGDLRYGSIKRVASAVGEGSISVAFTHQYLAGLS